MSTQSFTVKHPSDFVAQNRLPASSADRIIQKSLGPTSTDIPASHLAAGYIFGSPATGASPSDGQVYTLPTASTILRSFGQNASNIPKISVGTVIGVTCINKGTVPMYIRGSTGTDGSIASIPAATGFTGTAPRGASKRVFIEFTSVSPASNSTVGPTGAYSVFT